MLNYVLTLYAPKNGQSYKYYNLSNFCALVIFKVWIVVSSIAANLHIPPPWNVIHTCLPALKGSLFLREQMWSAQKVQSQRTNPVSPLVAEIPLKYFIFCSFSRTIICNLRSAEGKCQVRVWFHQIISLGTWYLNPANPYVVFFAHYPVAYGQVLKFNDKITLPKTTDAPQHLGKDNFTVEISVLA